MGILDSAMRFLTGGSKQKSSSESNAQSTSESYGQSDSFSISKNLAYDFLQNKLGGMVDQAGQAPDLSIISSLLGYSDPAAGRAGFDQYKRNTGFDFLADRGAGGIVGNRAAAGMLNSGGTQKELAQFGTGLQSQFLNQYLDSLFNLAGMQQQEASRGLTAADILRGAGAYSQSDSEAFNRSNSQSTATSKSTGSGSSQGGLIDIFKAVKPGGA